MQYYLAPLEGITGFVFRNAFRDYFGGADVLFAPFVSPASTAKIIPKEKRDILPENNRGVNLIPQILTNQADWFVGAAREMQEMGYTSVNLNLGCPAKTVVGKKKGSGMLVDLDYLDAFLERIFDACPIPVSVKTRLGKLDADDFPEIMDIYNRYPITELIIHPRVQADFYKGTLKMDQFALAFEKSRCPVCYNGDIRSVEDAARLQEQFPALDRIMIGRGILANPGLFRELRGEKRMTKDEVHGFMERLCRDYSDTMSGGEIPVLYKMKEMWVFLHTMFTDSEKYAKKIKKAASLKQYHAAMEQLFEEQDII